MRVYVANCTQQVQDFAYRVLGQNGIRRQTIEIGRQVLLSGSDWGTPEIEHLVKQHARYGMVALGDVDRTKPFVGLCYSIDKPVPVEKLRRALAHNKEVLQERGKVLRQETAVAMNSILEEGEAGGPKELEVSVEELPMKDGSKDQEVNDTVLVSRSDEPSAAAKSGGKNKKQK